MISNEMEDPNNQNPEGNEEWEGEVPEYMQKRIDQIVEQIRKEPLPKPAKSKRRKTKGKKKFDRKVLSSDTMGLGQQLTEIRTNVIETREALFNMYKIDKERFKFKKKIDKKLTTRLAAKRREAELEKTPTEPGEENTSEKIVDKKRNGILDALIDTLSNAGLAGLSSTLASFALPFVLDGVQAFLNRETKGERNQPYDFLGIIPDPKGDEEDDPITKFINFLIPKPENSAEPSVRSGDRTPQTGFNFVPSRDKSGKVYGDTSSILPIPRAYDGGQFTEGVKKPLQPINNIPPVDPQVQKLTEPLSSAILVPQKVATLGVLNLANNILKPFGAVLPKDMNKKIKDATSTDSSLLDRFKNFFGGIKNSIFGIGGANAQNVVPDQVAPDQSESGSATTTTGTGTKEQRAMLDAIAMAEGTTASYGTIYGGNVVPELARGELTINEVLEMQKTGMLRGRNVGYAVDKHDSDATGRHQFMSYVLEEEMQKQGISGDTLFTPELQDQMILSRISGYRKVTPELLAKEGMSDKVIDMLAPEFASFPNLFGPDSKGRDIQGTSFYGQGGKSAQSIRDAYNRSLNTPDPEPVEQRMSGLTPTEEDMDWYNKLMEVKPGKINDNIDIQQNPRREMNMFERLMNYLGGTPTQQPIPKVDPPKITQPVGSDPMLQPGGY